MNQAERDRLVTLRKVKRRVITQAEAAAEAIAAAVAGSDQAGSDPDFIRACIRWFRADACGRVLERQAWTERQQRDPGHWMMEGKLWRGRRRKCEPVHLQRPRRTRCGELIQWDTSDHDWLEGRGERLYLISMIDDATSRLYARFVTSDS
ncbi:MAG: transcriptional regulator, partial [Bryobacteraceae bacterium]